MQPLINMITDHNQFWITQGDSNMTYQKDYTQIAKKEAPS